MASGARVEEFRRLNEDIEKLALADLAAAWARADKTDASAARDALTEAGAAIVEVYGRATALVATQFYDDLRAESPNAKGRFSATVQPPPDRAEIEGSARWAVAALTGADGDSDAALERMAGAMQRHVAQAGRDTISRNMYRDPSPGGWARVPGGGSPCGFCRSLASRGPVYRSEATAAGQRGAYHDRDKCVPTPIWDGDDLPEGYDPDGLYDEYLEARAVTDSGDLAKIAAELDVGRPR